MRPTILSRAFGWRLACMAILLALLFPGSANAENRVSVGVVSGQRTARASDVTFSSIVKIDGQRYQRGTALLFVDDMSGTNAGWRLTVGLPVDSSSVMLVAVSDPQTLAGQAIDPMLGPDFAASTALGDLRQQRVVLAAHPGAGRGSYQIELTLLRPLDSEAAPADSLNLTVTIAPNS